MKELIALLTLIAGFIVWLAQRRIDTKMEIFKDAVKSLIAFEVDVANHQLQKDNCNIDNNLRRPYPFLRDETLELTQRCTGLVNAFFSQDISKDFTAAINTVSLVYKDGSPIIKGMYSPDKRQMIINRLSKELSVSFMFKEWLCRLSGCKRLDK